MNDIEINQRDIVDILRWSATTQQLVLEMLISTGGWSKSADTREVIGVVAEAIVTAQVLLEGTPTPEVVENVIGVMPSIIGLLDELSDEVLSVTAPVATMRTPIDNEVERFSAILDERDGSFE